ncbi:cobyric acid synthase [Labrys monachus]|uniref:Cobyric acid synthase n=1 Tax=Labrys monachus TaxID=217067 RepID=A0ABU0FQP3_9HYPH|nr:cobyric acid synthase [Labrys monachus]MDQ0396378.1 adenosylcobyric acid synthase [Labrys monachus]
MAAKILMIQGTGSDVGKSLVVAGLCRIFTDLGLRVRPFKPQNMSNNAAVTPDGGEIGRAQALQARAARVPPSVHMNPVLLKPQSETGAQIIVQGRMRGSARARDYQALKAGLMDDVLASFAHLRAEADLVIAEGAGSASEVNLRANDIANMGFAQAVQAPVVLVGDIDRGGVVAQILGTKAAIDPADAALIRGFIVNRMRGDPALFADGMRFIAERSGWPALGLVPHFADAARLPAEDALALAAYGGRKDGAKVTVAVPMMPRISNFDDLDPLAQEDEVELVMVRPGAAIPVADLVILPGSKATIADLQFLRGQGWDIDIAAHVRRGGRLLGLCGGYQMLGTRIEDPDGIEGPPGAVPGLGLLDVATRLTGDKRLLAVRGCTVADGVPFSGYEMHVGVTEGPATARAALRLADGSPDGACSPDGRVTGCYVHGLFADDRQRAAWLARLGAAGGTIQYEAVVEETLDAFAAHLAAHLDMAALKAICL